MAWAGAKRWTLKNSSFRSRQNVRNLNYAAGNATKAAHPSEAAGRKRHSEGSNLYLPGATVATLMMLGALHIRRMYEEKQVDEARRQGREPEFVADWKATFLQMLPLRFISRTWGSLTSVELPVWLRPHVYNGWARAFNANLDEASLPIEEYVSLRDFFTRTLKEGARPLDPSTTCLLSPVDGVVLQCGQVTGTGTMIEQVKGFSYSVSSLLGANPHVSSSSSSLLEDGQTTQNPDESEATSRNQIESATEADSLRASSSQHILTRSPSETGNKGLFYCVLYLGPGDYHRIHSPSDWDVFYRRHFYGRLYPVNERAVRTIKNLYVLNERVVLEGRWSQGFMAMAAVGATNVGSIELKFEPELKTNIPKVGLSLATINSRSYGQNGLNVKAGEEVAVFNLGSTVVLVFEAPSVETEDLSAHEKSRPESRNFRFTVANGERIKMGQALGDW
ncbi:phosphatidylserine decarboxylase [Marchantia polymorpha subsp. ruderalis]|uniref:Phosphatidylserine decarboxylase proenzyme 1, mitochondrial n=2 Tax=Marchantia polymorpha TaxID=3197 RepID=A0AAF6BSW2_MARPO|nr:hypothetical protein MARPO_0144s0014 [Marchantia polymorpha]BBN15096.1 hypothetical protein Mp_6g16990 [Marchantia polymorpha subsp. ruderalis]|eukprot:PTQ29295.1 hypothetical protein MARPO_0144s0014 [Marchantia polymorpha]